MFADVIFSKNFSRAFTYRIPEKLQGSIQPGHWVVVPFGQKVRPGIVARVSSTPPVTFFPPKATPTGIREILDLGSPDRETSFDRSLMTLCNQMSEYYMAPLGLCLRLIQPPRFIEQRMTRRISLTASGRKACHDTRISSSLAHILTRLEQSPKGLAISTLKKSIPSTEESIRHLKRRGWVQEIQTLRTPALQQSTTIPNRPRIPEKDSRWQTGGPLPPSFSLFPLPDEKNSIRSFHETATIRKVWQERIYQSLQEHRFQELMVYSKFSACIPVLLHAIEDTLGFKRTALIVTPDILTAELFVESAKHQWEDEVTLYHSSLSSQVRRQSWNRIQQGNTKIVVGTRSALFTPLPSLGLVGIIQEEHVSYKDEQSPYYHARDIAKMRAQLQQAVLLLCSSHPSLETFHHFGLSDLSVSSHRDVVPSLTPDLQVVNLKTQPYDSVLSSEMLEGIQTALNRKGGAILFLNRKGFSRALVCKTCGHIPQCHQCDVSLTFFKTSSRLICSYCGQSSAVPILCPSCQGTQLAPMGFGTERIEEIIHRQFPNATVRRFDRNTISSSREAQILCREFQEGRVQILIGTQMLLPGIRLPLAEFVGIPFADSGLHYPDFRSAERVYQQLRQAVDLARSKNEGGKVLLQSFLPTHHVIQAIVENNPMKFYHHELACRKMLGYPPFSHLILLTIAGPNLKDVSTAATKWADLLRVRLRMEGLPSPHTSQPVDSLDLILGPVPFLKAPSRSHHANKILVKAKELGSIREIILVSMKELETEQKRHRVRFSINVDPVELG